ncbi:MAG: hypothetical protein RQ936_04945 [Gammaproteobacteria bacterium]|nr:hypothetical protein [Gammaproteobacteria bacterium]
MIKFGEAEITLQATAFNNRDICGGKNVFHHRCFLPALLERIGIYKRSVDITGTILRQHHQQKKYFHLRNLLLLTKRMERIPFNQDRQQQGCCCRAYTDVFSARLD